MDDTNFLKLAVSKAYESFKKGGFPAGAVIVKDGKIITDSLSIGYLLNDPTSHAELASVRQACQILKTSDLTGCIMYASLQPCVMCYSSANWAHISKIVYGCQKTEEMIRKTYYEGFHHLDEINNKSNHKIELEYINDFEEEMIDLVGHWESQQKI